MKTVKFFTEMQFEGTIPSTFSNMRTEFAWMHLMQAQHHNISKPLDPQDRCDVAIVILPKTNPNFNLQHIRKVATTVCIMQEGPNWFWQDWPLNWQIEYLNLLNGDLVDVVLCHNKADKEYYRVITNKLVYHLPTALINQAITPEHRGEVSIEQRSGVIVGGNMVSWYGGMDSFIVAKNFKQPIFAPSMGRKTAQEQQFEEIQYLPYMEWSKWMSNLRQFKYAVHLMRTHAAGTFALNCAYYGIPCIGYKGLDTQQLCHPSTTVQVGDLVEARRIAQRLRDNEQFYQSCCTQAKMYFEAYYGSQNWTNNEFFKKFIQNGQIT